MILNTEMLLNLSVIGGLVGIAAYCGSCTVHVWRSRNLPGAAATAAPRRVRNRLCAGMLLGGFGLVLAAYVARLATQREGLLAADGVFTVRLPARSHVRELAAGGAVQAGAVLAMFRSPEREAQVAALTLKQQVIEAEKRLVLKQPLPLDAELVRRHQEMANERRHLESSRDQLLPALDVVQRERLREGAAKREEINRLAGEADRLQDELEQAAARKELADAQVKRLEVLAADQSASTEEQSVKTVEAKVLGREVEKLKTQLAHARDQKAKIEEDLKKLDGLTTEQAELLNRDIERVRNRLHSLPGDDPAAGELSGELARAEARRDARLQQLDAELRQCQGELSALTGALAVTAPFAGHVAYREAAPNNVTENTAVLVLASQDAFKLRVRLPRGEAEALGRAGTVLMELQNPGIERRFEGRLTASKPLAHDDGYVLAELACKPPADAVRSLGCGEKVPVTLLWSPPIWSSALFRTGFAMALTGGLIPLISLWRRSNVENAVTTENPERPTSASAPPALVQPQPTYGAVLVAGHPADSATLEAGSVAPMLRLLGSRLREAVSRGSVDIALLASVEWALDRHHARAVRLLSASLGDDDCLVDRIDGLSPEELASPTEQLDRLLRLLRAVGGPRLRQRIRDLDRAASNADTRDSDAIVADQERA